MPPPWVPRRPPKRSRTSVHPPRGVDRRQTPRSFASAGDLDPNPTMHGADQVVVEQVRQRAGGQDATAPVRPPGGNDPFGIEDETDDAPKGADAERPRPKRPPG